jgi:hypothetical protein
MSSAMRKRIFEAANPIISRIDEEKKLQGQIGNIGYLSEATLKLIEYNASSERPKSTSVYYV